MEKIQPATGNLTDRSGSVGTGGQSQLLAPANPDRKYLFVQNNSTGDLWINFSAAATTAPPSIKIPTGAFWFMEASFVSAEPIYITGATTSQAYTAKEA